MERFLKGIIVGLGGVAPGLSGSVLLIIFGLYQKTLEALGTLLTDLRRNVRFLLPLVAGMFSGVLLFSKVLDFLLRCHEVPTRFCFLGLILGTLPMVWKEVRKEGLKKWHYGLILLAALGGFALFTADGSGFPQVTDPSLVQCIALGVAVAATAIIPGVDPAVFLSSLGFYEMYLRALAQLDLAVLGPMVIGLAAGAVGISFGMSLLLRRLYSATYCVIFGIFLSMIPNMLTAECLPGCDGVSIAVMAAGFAVSLYLGDYRRFNRLLREKFQK